MAFGNGNVLPISHIDTLSLNPQLKLQDILIVPHINKKVLSVSKLTNDSLVDIIFSRSSFAIQDALTKRILATGTHRDGLYILNPGSQAFAASVVSSNRISFDLWHKRLGHVAHDIIFLLNKRGCLRVSSILPTPTICSSCELSKQHRLPFQLNAKRSLHVLDLVHYDLWGPAHVTSVE